MRTRSVLAAVLGVLAAALALGASTLAAAPQSAERVLVKVDHDASPAERAEVRDELGARAVRSLGGGWRVYELDAPTTLAEARRRLAGADADRIVELDHNMQLADAPQPALSPDQWALHNDGSQPGSTAGVDTRALAAWRMLGDPAELDEVVVAVIDTGIWLDHPDLAGRILTDADGQVVGRNFHPDDAPDQIYNDPVCDRHGTHVAGTIAAANAGGDGVLGVAPNARIMPLRIIDGDLWGSGLDCDWDIPVSAAIAAIDFAIANGADVINASWEMHTESKALCEAITRASDAGVLFVAAAGNGHRDIDSSPSWPASCPDAAMLSVAGLGPDDRIYEGSNYGKTSVDLVAPGVDVLSTIPPDPATGAIYKNDTGTSMAAPHVAGAAAILLGRNPDMTPLQLRACV